MTIRNIPKKKLFLIINRLALAGGSMDALSMAFYLKDKYDITVVYGEKERDEKEAPLLLNSENIQFIKIKTLHRAILPFKDIQSYKQIRTLIRKHQPDIVHTHGFKSGLLGRIAAYNTKVPVIIHTYHGHLFHSYYNKAISRFIAFIERKLAAISTRIIAISPHQAYELATVYRIAPLLKICTIFIGIDEERYSLQSADSNTFRQRYNIPEHTIIIAIIGRLVSIKNLSLFIPIIQQIQQQHEDVCFFIIGDGNCKTTMQQEMQQKGINWYEGSAAPATPANVIFTSWITNISEALQSIDIVVLTSYNEGTPVSLIEAQLFQKPVVATNVGGVRDTIIDGETGFLVANFSIEDFVKKLQLLIHDKTLRMRMGSKGKAFVLNRFSKEKETDAMDKLYIQCLQAEGIV
ncbi:glycosyltransferase family 4 protein [Ilyomonas limi]|uniref:Glycosyltransferase family 4 protein n=1 Tax=Ilyomonas limi TaxID=2575867 RepID=A0A4U3L798_9BACT|nr:glycosyltransferase [Ilyomonas limi]TKK70902.1 glycosyltransferase family 4 protein [Ilyomonas limi]